MSDRVIIILEGADMVGKTSVAQVLQRWIPNHAMIKLSQPRSPLSKQERLTYLASTFRATAELWKVMHDNNGIMDRFSTSERVYGPLFHGFTREDYQVFDQPEKTMADAGAVQFVLVASKDTLLDRLAKKIKESPNEDHSKIDQLMDIQGRYIEIGLWGTKLPTQIIKTDEGSPEDIAREILSRLDVRLAV